jgi:hypothetical protein
MEAPFHRCKEASRGDIEVSQSDYSICPVMLVST